MKNLRLWWKFEARYYHRDLVQGIKNLITWFPTIWKLRDWDYHYIYDVLDLKLKKAIEYTTKYKRFEGWEFMVRDLQICRNLISKLQEDYYSIEYMEDYKTSHEFHPTDETKKWYTMEITVESNTLQNYFNKYPKLYEKYKHKGEDHLVAMHMGIHLHKKARRLLFKIIEDKIESWWD